MDTNLRVILQQLQAEKSIDWDTLIEAIRSAIESAARKSLNYGDNIIVDVDPDKVTFAVFEVREVVEDVSESAQELSLEDAQALNPDAKIGDRLKVATEQKDFGRIAAQTAKQVIIQKIKDAERDNVYEEFKNREGELITGLVKRYSHGNLVISVGHGEAVIPQKEQSPRENFRTGDRIRAYLATVERTQRGPEIVLSRNSPELVRGLFDLEVPEIFDGTIEIRSIAREAGSRTKIAVYSNDPNVDPVGACVGMKGSRVRAVVEELNGEKIDIVRWSEDPAEFCGSSLNPADILNISINEENKSVLVVVPNDQLSLAIGKRGQNARLASKLIGWSIDIRSEVELTGEVDPDAETDGEASADAETPAVDADAPAVETDEATATEETESPDEGETSDTPKESEEDSDATINEADDETKSEVHGEAK
jgi:N utilization substance protein A